MPSESFQEEGGERTEEGTTRYIRQLQTMRVITPEVTNELTNLYKVHTSGSVIWETARQAIAKWQGQSTAAAQTFEGAMAVIRNTWTVLKAEFGKPIDDALRPLLVDRPVGFSGASGLDFHSSVRQILPDLREAARLDQ